MSEVTKIKSITYNGNNASEVVSYMIDGYNEYANGKQYDYILMFDQHDNEVRVYRGEVVALFSDGTMRVL